MVNNIGRLDRVARFVLGVVLIALALVGPQTPWGWLGVIPLATSLMGSCPAYTLFGVRTCRAQRSEQRHTPA